MNGLIREPNVSETPVYQDSRGRACAFRPEECHEVCSPTRLRRCSDIRWNTGERPPIPRCRFPGENTRAAVVSRTGRKRPEVPKERRFRESAAREARDLRPVPRRADPPLPRARKDSEIPSNIAPDRMLPKVSPVDGAGVPRGRPDSPFPPETGRRQVGSCSGDRSSGCLRTGSAGFGRETAGSPPTRRSPQTGG